MITGYINSIVSKHFYNGTSETHLPEDDTFYDVLNDKLEDLNRAGNLPIFTGFYTEYLDDAKNGTELDNKFVLQNFL